VCPRKRKTIDRCLPPWLQLGYIDCLLTKGAKNVSDSDEVQHRHLQRLERNLEITDDTYPVVAQEMTTKTVNGVVDVLGIRRTPDSLDTFLVYGLRWLAKTSRGKAT